MEQAVDFIQPLHRAQFVQDGLLVQHPHGDILGDEVGDIARVSLDMMFMSISAEALLGRQLTVAVKEFIGLADGRLGRRELLFPS